MGLKLERQRRKTEKINEKINNLNEDSFDLEQQHYHVKLMENARASNQLDDSVEKSIDEISHAHFLELKRVKAEQNTVNNELNELVNDIEHEIHKLEEGRSRLKNIEKFPYGIDLSRELAEYKKHIEEWKKLLYKLKKLRDFQVADNKILTQFNNLIVQGQRFTWNTSLSTEERKALEAYTNNQYRNINGYLRGNRKFPVEDTELGKFYIWNLHNSLSRAATKEAITVYRGLFNNAVLNKYENASDDDLVGKVIHDPAFMSTSFDLNIAKEYSKDTILKIFVPKGSHGMYISENAAYSYEKEFLLDKGQIMRIESVEHIEGKRYLNVSILAKRHNTFQYVNPFRITEKKDNRSFSGIKLKNKDVKNYEDLIKRNNEAKSEFQKLITDFQKETGGKINTRFKSEDRIHEKIQDDYKGDYSRCIDVLGDV